MHFSYIYISKRYYLKNGEIYKIKDLKTQIKVTSLFNYTVAKRIFSFTKMEIAIREKILGYVY